LGLLTWEQVKEMAGAKDAKEDLDSPEERYERFKVQNIKNPLTANQITLDASKQEKEEKIKMPKNDYLKHIKKIKKQREEKQISNQEQPETVEPTNENIR